MSTSGSDGFGAKDLVTWLVIGVVAILALKLLFLIGGFALKVILFVLFTVGPILLIGWVVVRVLRYLTRETQEESF